MEKRIDRFDLVPGERIEARDLLDAVAEKLDAHRILSIARAHLHRVAAHAKVAAGEFDIVAVVLHVHKLAQEVVARHFIADRHQRHHFKVVFGRTQPVDARHAGDDDHIAPRQ